MNSLSTPAARGQVPVRVAAESTANVTDTHFCLGSVVGPHPYPYMVRQFQSIVEGLGLQQQVGPRALKSMSSAIRHFQSVFKLGGEGARENDKVNHAAVPAQFRDLAEVEREYRRSVVHLFPAAEQFEFLW